MIKRTIQLSKGHVLELEMEKEFLDRIGKHFNVPTHAITNEHIKRFIWQAASTALDKYDSSAAAE